MGVGCAIKSGSTATNNLRTDFFSVGLFTPNSVLEHLALCPELRFTPFGGSGRFRESERLVIQELRL